MLDPRTAVSGQNPILAQIAGATTTGGATTSTGSTPTCALGLEKLEGNACVDVRGLGRFEGSGFEAQCFGFGAFFHVFF